MIFILFTFPFPRKWLEEWFYSLEVVSEVFQVFRAAGCSQSLPWRCGYQETWKNLSTVLLFFSFVSVFVRVNLQSQPWWLGKEAFKRKKQAEIWKLWRSCQETFGDGSVYAWRQRLKVESAKIRHFFFLFVPGNESSFISASFIHTRKHKINSKYHCFRADTRQQPSQFTFPHQRWKCVFGCVCRKGVSCWSYATRKCV